MTQDILTGGAFDNDGNRIYTPDVNLKLDVTLETVVTIGVTKLRFALQTRLKSVVAECGKLSTALTKLQSDRDAAVAKVDEPDFLALVSGRTKALADCFNVAQAHPRLEVSKALDKYDRAVGRRFVARLDYSTANSAADSGHVHFYRTYPTPAAIEAIEVEIDATTAAHSEASKLASELRVQLHDRAGLHDHITTELSMKLLNQSGAAGQSMLEALLGPASNATNPALALLDASSTNPA